jgi:RNA recognition motif-containing protein
LFIFAAKIDFNMKVFVGGLPLDMDDQEFKEIFEDYGSVNSAQIVMDRFNGTSRGFGFVDFLEKSSAENVISRLDGGELDGRRLTVRPAERSRQRTGYHSGTHHNTKG